MEFNKDIFLYNVLKQRELECFKYIELLSDDIIMANTNEEILKDAFNKYSYSTIEISEEIEEERNFFEKEIDNPYRHFAPYPVYEKIKGIHFIFVHKYNGDFELLQYRASSTIYWSPHNIEVSKGSITFYYEIPYSDDIDKMMKDVIKEYEDDLNNFKKLIGFANNDIDKFNKELILKINSKIDEKRKRVSNLDALRQKMSIDIKKRPDAPNFTPIQVVKKTKQLSTKVTKENEYYIPEEDYEEILRRIRHSGSSMERIPSTYSTMSEEQLRDIIVSKLNVDYEGMVQGESFRNKGKTDICIEYNNRAAFVTECKIWKGKNTLSKTISQLLSYITWKDSKLSIIFFNKNNKDFFNVINVIESNLKETDNYHTHRNIKKNEFELLLNSNNTGQIIKIRIFIFNIYDEKARE